MRRSRRIKVKELWVYPIKSCAGFQVASANIDDLGFENVRVCVLVLSPPPPNNILARTSDAFLSHTHAHAPNHNRTDDGWW